MTSPNEPALMVRDSEEVLPPPPSTEPKQDDKGPSEPVDDGKPEDTTAEAETETEEKEEPVADKPRSGYARKKAENQRLYARIAELEAQQRPPTPSDAEPKLDDFNGDYLAFEKASVAFAAKQAIRSELEQQRRQDLQARQVEARHESLQDFEERANEAKVKLPGFDDAIDTLFGTLGPLPESIRDKIADSDNGPQILYYLAKNPGAARDLYQSGPLDAVYEIGKLDQRMSLPKARNVTKAPPPMSTPKGGATPPSDIHMAAKSEDISNYAKMRSAMK